MPIRPGAATGTTLERMTNRPLRICFLTYRGNPHSGGQGIYTRHLCRALHELGHQVEVWSGPPYPELDPGVTLRQIPSLDLWNETNPFRRPSLAELRDPIHRSEWLQTLSGRFPEMHTFSQRVARAYADLPPERRFDIVHDNQCLGDGLLELRRMVPVVATIHHPVTVDRQIALAAASDWLKRLTLRRWYSFLDKQIAVAGQLDRVLTVSQAASQGIIKDLHIRPERVRIVPNGVDLTLFRPLPDIERNPVRLISTISAHGPLKGFVHLLDALVVVRRQVPTAHLTVIGKQGHEESERRVRELGLADAVRFTGRLSTEEMIHEYAQASVAVVPSLYEGFGLPAIEAMACEVPVVSTNAGALAEVVGEDGLAGLLVPPADGAALGAKILELLASPERRRTMGHAGRQRVAERFTWHRAAELCVDVYRELLDAAEAPQLKVAC